MSTDLDTYLDTHAERAAAAIAALGNGRTKEHDREAAWRIHRIVRMAEHGAVFRLPRDVAAACRRFMG